MFLFSLLILSSSRIASRARSRPVHVPKTAQKIRYHIDHEKIEYYHFEKGKKVYDGPVPFKPYIKVQYGHQINSCKDVLPSVSLRKSPGRKYDPIAVLTPYVGEELAKSYVGRLKFLNEFKTNRFVFTVKPENVHGCVNTRMFYLINYQIYITKETLSINADHQYAHVQTFAKFDANPDKKTCAHTYPVSKFVPLKTNYLLRIYTKMNELFMERKRTHGSSRFTEIIE